MKCKLKNTSCLNQTLHIVLSFNFSFISWQYEKILAEFVPRIGTRKFNSRHQLIGRFEHKASMQECRGNKRPGTIEICSL